MLSSESVGTAGLPAHLADQVDWHWAHQLRPRLDGLTDDEYFWQPVPHCWTVRRDDARMVIDFAFPPPEPAPVTTIAWRLAHVIVGVLAMRAHFHFGGPPASFSTWPYAGDAATALRQLDDAYELWMSGVRSLTATELDRRVGPAEGPWAERSMLDLVLHINRELIHHGAEIAVLRDLYAHTPHSGEH